MRASDLMARALVTLDEDATVGDAISAMSEHEIRHLPVVRGRKPIGVVSDRDLRSVEGALAAAAATALEPTEIETPASAATGYDTKVRSIIVGEPITIPADATAREVIDAMLGARVSSVLVVDAAGDLIGIISSIDVLRAARDVL